MDALLVLLGLGAAIHAVRQHVTHRRWPAPPVSPFEGELYRVGQTTIAVRRHDAAERTLVCMPGFLEDVRYFLEVYRDHPYDLILVNNADYHCPFDESRAHRLDWPANPHPVTTLAHDGFIVAHAAARLARTKTVVLHGHSRGGAVVLEAGRQLPSIAGDAPPAVSALLEAPVLPQGTPAGRSTGPVSRAMTLYLMPLAMALSRNISEQRIARLPMMKPTTPRKTELAKALFVNPKDYATAIGNVRDIDAWQRREGYELYDGYTNLAVLVGERDDVLSTQTMTASATEGKARNAGVRIVHTSNTNHFITLERPELVASIIDTL